MKRADDLVPNQRGTDEKDNPMVGLAQKEQGEVHAVSYEPHEHWSGILRNDQGGIGTKRNRRCILSALPPWQIELWTGFPDRLGLHSLI